MQTHVWLLCGGKFRSPKWRSRTFRTRLKLLTPAPHRFLSTISWGSTCACHGSCHPIGLIAGEEAFAWPTEGEVKREVWKTFTVSFPWSQAVWSWVGLSHVCIRRTQLKEGCHQLCHVSCEDAEKWQQRNRAALQPFKTISKKCVLRIELLLKVMIAKFTCFRRLMAFCHQYFLSHHWLLMWQWDAGVTQILAKQGLATDVVPA